MQKHTERGPLHEKKSQKVFQCGSFNEIYHDMYKDYFLTFNPSWFDPGGTVTLDGEKCFKFWIK